MRLNGLELESIWITHGDDTWMIDCDSQMGWFGLQVHAIYFVIRDSQLLFTVWISDHPSPRGLPLAYPGIPAHRGFPCVWWSGASRWLGALRLDHSAALLFQFSSDLAFLRLGKGESDHPCLAGCESVPNLDFGRLGWLIYPSPCARFGCESGF